MGALGVRRTPPMGWNSWDCYGTSVTEAEVLANAEFMAEHLASYGWDTVVVDIDWSDPGARAHGYNVGARLELGRFGRRVPDPGRFPSAAGGAGFGPLAERVHALGLRFGIHTMRGIPRLAVERDLPILGSEATASQVADRANVCEWHPHMWGVDHARPGAQEYYQSTLDLYASWGVDFVKCDDMLWPYQAAEIEAYARAIERCGRAVELSLSPGRDLSLERLEHLREHATMWRICDDLWDRWTDVEASFARFARWAPHAGERGWPDGDMLPLGRIGLRAEVGEPRDDRLTPAERRTLMTLWVIARSPLMIGGDLPSTDPTTIALFTNADVLDVLARSHSNREVIREGPLVVWTADGPGAERWVAVFNLGVDTLTVAPDAGDLGLDPAAPVHELWAGDVVAVVPVREQSDAHRGVAPGSAAVHLSIDPHGAVLLRGARRTTT
jgi:hypothetical protein